VARRVIVGWAVEDVVIVGSLNEKVTGQSALGAGKGVVDQNKAARHFQRELHDVG
jgi:hypothetical protein